MSAPSSIPQFWNQDERPAIGGWHYFENPSQSQTYFRRFSPGDVFAHIKQLRQNNGTFVSDIDIWRELWSYWCGKEPARCGLSAAASPESLGPLTPRELTRNFWGPIIWNAMNLCAVRFEAIGKENFLRFLGSVSSLMTCPECIGHWQEILASIPPSSITSTLEACQWVNAAHNRVNARVGVATYPYERMVREFGAPAS